MRVRSTELSSDSLFSNLFSNIVNAINHFLYFT